MTTSSATRVARKVKNTLQKLGIPLPSQDPEYQLSYAQIQRLQDKDGGYEPLKARKVAPTIIYKYAENVSNDLNVTGTTDLFKLIRVNGGRFSFVQHNEFNSDDGSIFIHKEREFDIVLPTFLSSFRNRFTIAHELGHYLLHSPRITSFAKRSESKQVEWEANWFAAGFLMPEGRFRKAVEEYGADLKILSSLFGVSEQSVSVRLKVLNGNA